MQYSSTGSGSPGRHAADHWSAAANLVRGWAARALAACLGALVFAVAPARAQVAPSDPRHVLAGSVRAADESRLAGAQVRLVESAGAKGGPLAVTDADGAFQFARVPDGTAQLIVRRLGFRPETLTVDVPQISGGAVVVMLERVAQSLSPVLVREARHAARLGSGFERRRSNGFGHFITREQIELQNPQRTSDLLRGMVGVTVTGGGPRFRAAGGASACEPAYFLDGLPIGGGALDLDAISPKSIESIEVYSGAATVPAALRSALTPGGCGAIALWTRHGDTPRETLGTTATTDSLADMVSHGWAYTADQVELAAAPLPGFAPAPAYPDSLLVAGVRGRVMAEFVVTEQGIVDPETIGIVSSTNRMFADAVRDAVAGARFSPAYRQHQVVRQVVHLPVVFEPQAAQDPARP